MGVERTTESMEMTGSGRRVCHMRHLPSDLLSEIAATEDGETVQVTPMRPGGWVGDVATSHFWTVQQEPELAGLA